MTSVIYKTLNPVWNESFKVTFAPEEANVLFHRLKTSDNDFQNDGDDNNTTDNDFQNDGDDNNTTEDKGDNCPKFMFAIFDRDLMTDDDNMGIITGSLPLTEKTKKKWYKVEKGEPGSAYYCRNASGAIEAEISVRIKKLLSTNPGDSLSINGSRIQFCLDWTLDSNVNDGHNDDTNHDANSNSNNNIDLDMSCVAINHSGDIMMEESVYFGSLISPNGSISHSGDAATNEKRGRRGRGEKTLGERITCKLDIVKKDVKALYFILNVATPEKSFQDVYHAQVTVRNDSDKRAICAFEPSIVGDHTAIILMRLSRSEDDDNVSVRSNEWKLTMIGDTDHTGEFIQLRTPFFMTCYFFN